MTTAPRRTIAALSAAVNEGSDTAAALVRDALARADDYGVLQPSAWITRVTAEQAIARAERVDRAVAAGERLPLAGIPFAVKDNIDVAGLPTTAGCPAFAYVPPATAPVVARLEAAGAVLIGKTNLDQFATGLVGTRSPYGIPACVYNRDYVSGGSSSGSAVVVAAGVVPFALGTDTAGSGRVPAAFNGLVGWKPSRGSWSTRGVVPACRSLDCVSVFTGDVADARAIDDVLRAFDADDPYSRRPGPASLGGGPWRLGIPQAPQRRFLGDAESAALYATAIERCVAAGFTVEEVDTTPFDEAAALLYGGPWAAERLAAVETLLASQPGAIHPVVRSIIQAARGVDGLDVFRGQYQLEVLRRRAAPTWDRVDVLLLPTTPTAYRIREVLADPVALNSHLGLYTNFVNLLDLCALAMPAGYRRNGTGFGVSVIAPAWNDAPVLAAASRIESLLAVPAPALDRSPAAPAIRLAVVGAHLDGMPLHWQLSSRGARLVARTTTAACYRLYAMRATSPPKPALAWTAAGSPIEVEVYELGLEAFGSFVAEVPPPLAIGTVRLADGSEVKGFVAEPRALDGAEDITRFGGWRKFVAAAR